MFEFRRFGQRSVRIAAIDPVTRTEVYMIGDITYGEETLKRLAARKLRYVLKKKLSDAEARTKNR